MLNDTFILINLKIANLSFQDPGKLLTAFQDELLPTSDWLAVPVAKNTWQIGTKKKEEDSDGDGYKFYIVGIGPFAAWSMRSHIGSCFV